MTTRLRRAEAVAGYLFLLPWLVGFFAFLFLPMLGAIGLSLFSWNGISAMRFRGVSNYTKAVTDPEFWKSIQVTAAFVVVALPVRMALALWLAVKIRAVTRLRGFFSTVTYVPAVIPGVALAILFTYVLNPDAGMLNQLLLLFGIHGPMWLFSENWALAGLGLMFVWQSGAAVILYLVGLETIPVELGEAAEIDGASHFQRFWRITFPLLTPIVLYNLIVGIIHNFQYFAPVFVMTQGGPNDATLFFMFNVYRTAFKYFELGYGAALSVILFVVIGGLTALAFKTSHGWVHYGGE